MQFLYRPVDFLGHGRSQGLESSAGGDSLEKFLGKFMS